jgi:asparagine synthase (glutamine-hydrolysing)
MCGLSGVFDGAGRADLGALRTLALGMAATLRHRGPDSGGVWVDDAARLALAHRRLAIIDLSAEGRQPMHSVNERWVIVFNGEIYNFRTLRAELIAAGDHFRGASDTEVLLAALDRFGLDRALERITGMFAFALWDRATRTLHLVRDRLGKKPLYFGWLGQSFVFASELKALAAHPEFAPEVDRGALSALLRYQYIPAPHSIWRGICKLPAGTRLAISLDDREARSTAGLLDRIRPYWCAKTIAEAGQAEPPPTSDAHALERLDALLGEAVAERMIADVPLGAFLSGGIDSSVIVALMQRHSARPVKTFTVGFAEQNYDEAADARQVANHLGTEHTELYVTPREAREVIPALPDIYDEPFADPSQIPTFHIARLARRHVTVCLSGDGGDEVFGGYQRYFVASGLDRRLRAWPPWLRRSAAGAMTALAPQAWDALLRRAQPRLPAGVRGHWSGDRMHKLAGLMRSADRDDLYHSLIRLANDPRAMLIDGSEPPAVFSDPGRAPRLDDYTHRMMYYDTVSYLPDDILVKIDRASMAVSLEARAPLLDHRVVEFAWTLPLSAKVRDGRGKWLLRQLFHRYLPEALASRPKQGFGVPLADWLRGPLRDWAETLLAEARLAEEGFFRPQPVRRKWQEHLSGTRNWSAGLWSVLMFQAWQERWLAGRRPSVEVAREAADSSLLNHRQLAS